MSGKRASGGFNPPDSPQLTLEQWKETVTFFKNVFEDSSLAVYIKMAGWGALSAVVLELGRMLWLAYRYLRGV
jgi:hypothetical protein